MSISLILAMGYLLFTPLALKQLRILKNVIAKMPNDVVALKEIVGFNLNKLVPLPDSTLSPKIVLLASTTCNSCHYEIKKLIKKKHRFFENDLLCLATSDDPYYYNDFQKKYGNDIKTLPINSYRLRASIGLDTYPVFFVIDNNGEILTIDKSFKKILKYFKSIRY